MSPMPRQCRCSPPVSNRVAPCGEYHAEVGKTLAEKHSGEIRAVLGRNESGSKNGRFYAFRWVERQAGERVGAVIRHSTRLTADGNADRTRVFDGFKPPKITVPYFRGCRLSTVP